MYALGKVMQQFSFSFFLLLVLLGIMGRHSHLEKRYLVDSESVCHLVAPVSSWSASQSPAIIPEGVCP